MLLLLMPDQVPSYWEDIKEGLGRALPEGGPDRRGLILQGLLLGTIEMWLSYRKEKGGSVVEAGIVTAVVKDYIHDTLNLLVYAAWAVGETTWDSWREAIASLKKYAKSRGCNRLVTLSNEKIFLDLAEATGGEAKYKFLTWDV